MKNILLSKTFWFSVLTPVAMLVPQIKSMVIDKPELFASLWGMAGVVLRLITKDKVVLIG